MDEAPQPQEEDAASNSTKGEPGGTAKRGYLSFSGGGAKGIAHLGAWYAITARQEFEVEGVSGTSAGALMAGLVAAGFGPEEIYDTKGRRPGDLLDLLGVKQLPDLFQLRRTGPSRIVRKALLVLGRLLALGGARWWALRLLPFRDAHLVSGFNRPIWLLATLLLGYVVVIAPLLALAVGALSAVQTAIGIRTFGEAGSHAGWFALHLALTIAGHAVAVVIAALCDGPHPARGLVLLMAFAAMACGAMAVPFASGDPFVLRAVFVTHFLLLAFIGWQLFAWLSGGLFDHRPVRDGIGRVLKARFGDPDITFDAFVGRGALDLRVVATNIGTKSMHVFGVHQTPKVAVADALVASMAIPVLFSPVPIDAGLAAGGRQREGRNDLFLDGGLVSNLPAWAFDDERRYLVPAPLLAFDIREDERARDTRNSLAAAARTIVFGSHSLNFRAIEGLSVQPVHADHDLLAFDLSAPDAKRAIKTVQERTYAEMALRAQRLRILEFALQEFHRRMCERARTAGERPQDVRGMVFGLRQPHAAIVEGGLTVLRPLLSLPASTIATLRPIALDRTGAVPSPIGEAWTALEPYIGTDEVREVDAIAFRPNYHQDLKDADSEASRHVLAQLPRDLVWSLAATVSNPLGQFAYRKESFAFVIDGRATLTLSDDELNAIYEELLEFVDLARALVPAEV